MNNNSAQKLRAITTDDQNSAFDAFVRLLSPPNGGNRLPTKDKRTNIEKTHFEDLALSILREILKKICRGVKSPYFAAESSSTPAKRKSPSGNCGY